MQYSEDCEKAILLVGDNFIEALEHLFLSGDYKWVLRSAGVPETISKNMCEDSYRAALTFAIQHEVAHAKRGHLKYWKSENYQIVSYARNRIEADADAMASGWLAPCIFREKLNISEFHDWWFSALTAIPILYSHWDNGNVLETYPEFSVRYFLIKTRLSAFLNEHLPEISSRFPALSMKTGEIAHRFCASREMPTTLFVDDSSSIAAWCNSHFDEMGQFMERIYSESDFIQNDSIQGT